MLIRKTQALSYYTMAAYSMSSFPADSCQKNRDIMPARSVLVEDYKIEIVTGCQQDLSFKLFQKFLSGRCKLSSLSHSISFTACRS